MAKVTSGHSVFDQASDCFTIKAGYSPVDGTKPSVKGRFRMGRSGTPDPEEPVRNRPPMTVVQRLLSFTSKPAAPGLGHQQFMGISFSANKVSAAARASWHRS